MSCAYANCNHWMVSSVAVNYVSFRDLWAKSVADKEEV